MGKRNDELLAKLNPEQRAEFDAMRAESRTPESRLEQARQRLEAEAEFPPKLHPAAAELIVRLGMHRKKKKLSMEKVAALTGMPESAISKLEAGKGNPTVATLSRYARALGLRIEMTVVEDT